MQIICFGDSITYGFPYGPEISWVKYVAFETGLQVLNAGENGDTSYDLLNRLNNDVIRHRPEYCFILIGANDACIGLVKDQFIANIENLIIQMSGAGITPILGLPIPSFELALEKQLAGYRDELLRLAKKDDFLILDFAPAMQDHEGKLIEQYYLDEVHPSVEGYKAMGRHALSLFQRLQNEQF